MKLHRLLRIEDTKRAGNTNIEATCSCGQKCFGHDWSTSEFGINKHIEANNNSLRMSSADAIFHAARPGNGHVGNHEDSVTDEYLAIAGYVLARGFDPDA